MENTHAEIGKPLTSRTVWTWVIIATAVPFVMLVAMVIIMVSLNFNILDWME